MLTPQLITCPYCGEEVEIYLDPESRGEMVHDCEVCCNPWLLAVERDGRGNLSARAERLQ